MVSRYDDVLTCNKLIERRPTKYVTSKQDILNLREPQIALSANQLR